MKIRDEFIIERQGKQFVLFAGLLEQAHKEGLHSIDTALIQVPDADNGNLAIVFASVTMDHDEDDPKDRRKFSGHGDASPDNVSRNIAPHIIRMAETRAKARALRDAINVGAAAFEELSDDDERPDVYDRVREAVKKLPTEEDYDIDDASGLGQTARQETARLRGAAKDAAPKKANVIRKSQADMIRVLWQDLGGDDSSLEAYINHKLGCGPEDITTGQAENLIFVLSERLNDTPTNPDVPRVPEDDVLDSEDLETIEELSRGSE